MDLSYSADDLDFREEARAFIAQAYPDELRRAQARGGMYSKDEYLAWHRILAAKGWIAPRWPAEYGGPGWSISQRYIWADELARADTLPLIPLGLTMLGPVVYTFGTPEQKARFLPGTLSGDIWWAQGYSEPGAGSDLASLATRAVRDGDHYVVNGTKLWTSLAQYADWGFFLVRTDPDAKVQRGISFLLIDMNSPGVTVGPIRLINGAPTVSQVWLEDVRVPIDQLIHKENEGWNCAKFLLTQERAGIANVALSRRGVAKVRAAIAKRGVAPAEHMERALAEIEIELEALAVSELRVLAAEAQGRAPGGEASLLKVRGTEIYQRITELAVAALGPYAAPWLAPMTESNSGWDPETVNTMPHYLHGRATSIYGGSNEIQRNIIAKAVLGL